MIKFDGNFDIATGLSAGSKIWKNEEISWSTFIQKLFKCHKTTETYKTFLAATKEEQTKIKDVGGYVGGYLRSGRRGIKNVIHRQLLTLDIDFAHIDLWEDYTLLFDNAAVLHSTHKHCDVSPRFRLIMPLSRECAPDEYVAVARQIAGIIGIDLFDKTTFETNRLMFWPSSPSDVDYYFKSQDGPWINVDEILASYTDWTNTSLWPTSEKEFDEIKNKAEKQQDPELKKGIVGAFCRTYTIQDVIENFLSDIYSKAEIDNRYTYIKGSTSAGLIVYDDKFAYSHHGTDPCGGKLCNAFDLVRIHLYSHLDEGLVKGQKLKSFSAMEDLSINDKNVKGIIAEEKLQDARYDFEEFFEEEEEDIDIKWMQELDVNSKGEYLSTSTNLNLIFLNDRRFKEIFRYNDFDNKRYVFGNLPWRRVVSPSLFKNVDESGIRNYIESIYGISSALKINDALAIEFEKNHFHPVKDYLNNLKWDKTQRVDTILINLFGAEDNIYVREAFRKMTVGAVARIFNPGVKFDLVLTLVSQIQGTGKSSIFRALGGQWFSDSFFTVQGTKAYEQLFGAWIIEIAELAGLRKADVESIKHFVTKQEDMFRPAFGHFVETYLRQCVFVATTNQKNYLKDPTGNRRFMPIDTQDIKLEDNSRLKSFLGDKYVIDQIWAEAVYLYRHKEKLYLSPEAEKIASIEQKKHCEYDERRGIIEAYLNIDLPVNWDSMDLFERRMYFDNPKVYEKEKQERIYTCVAEVWCECLGKNREDMDRYKTREINDILKSLDDWEFINSTKNFEIYGKQKFFAKKLD